MPRGHRHLPADRVGGSRALASTATGAAPYVEEALRWTALQSTPLTLDEELTPSPPAETGRARILLADDNADMREYVGRLLKERWDVEAVPDGQAALTAIRRQRPDVVLADVMMPALDGFALLRAIREDAALRLTPVILLSARAGEEATAEGLNAGANDYIVKPFSARELLVRVASTLAVAAAAREGAQELSRLLANTEASERQFRELVENLPELAWTARPDGFIDYYNRRWYDYTGTTFESMQGWGWTTVHDPAQLDVVIARWRESIDTGEPFEMEFPLRGADGIFQWFLTRVRPLRDANGRIVRWFGSNTNIDERRRNDDFKETFVGVLGHDLRNPLNTILTTSRVLTMREDTTADLRKKLERIISSGVRMQRMIEQLLDLTRARLTAGIPVMLSPDPVNLETSVARIVDEVRAGHPASTIEIRVQGDCSARIDTDRFEQVMSNLLGNAVTHGDATKPIRVTLQSTPTVAIVSVQNQGSVIESQFLPLLFNPFARGQKPLLSSAGLGLGLYISERIVDAHHGTLAVESSHEEGTTFTVRLPRPG